MSRSEIIIQADAYADRAGGIDTDEQRAAAQLCARAMLLNLAGIECAAAQRDAKDALLQVGAYKAMEIPTEVYHQIELAAQESAKAVELERREDGTITGPLTGHGTPYKRRESNESELKSPTNILDAHSEDLVEGS
ncbi:MAG: hypothetical protein RL885_25045 [Planctomycetota bacterium]